ncbi:MAG: hypothetical protein MJ078_03825, partial [Clostridia bacterium]|nr:hypothetical protein [Clostridia bacterium]
RFRTDAALAAVYYGGEFAIDVHRIFRDFDADENDPASYSFGSTDTAVKNAEDAGTHVFYRLGSNIEHGEKRGTYPPKDFLKWAKVCEHIIRHYTEGWADGFRYDMQYWEIWNEPDCQNADGSNPCWQGTFPRFAEFLDVSARYLKKAFPRLYIGGPAMAWMKSDGAKAILPEMQKRQTPLDFFSYHCYCRTPEQFAEQIALADELLAAYGYGDIPHIINECNYICGWTGDGWRLSLKREKSLFGASFWASLMSVAHTRNLSMLMYYDARPCGMNGIFDTDTLVPLSTYYTFLAYRQLRRLGKYVPTLQDFENGVYSCAATDGEKGSVMFTRFAESDEEAEETVLRLSLQSDFALPYLVRVYVTDKDNAAALWKEEVISSPDAALYIKAPLHTVFSLETEPIKE